MDYPVLLVFVGAVVSAFGALWSSNKQGAESKELYRRLAEKSDTITGYAKKQEKASETNTKLYQQLAEKSDEIAEYAKKQEQASKNVSELQQMLLEKANFQLEKTEQIAKLNAELAESQKEIAKLSQDISYNVTGGNSFCYITLSSSASNKIRVEVFHQGKYPLSNVRMYITNQSAVQRLAGNDGAKTRIMGMFRRSSATQFTLNNLAPSNASVTIGELESSDAGWTINDSYFIEFIANNGSWEQQYQTANTSNSYKGIFVIRRNGATILER